MPTDPPNARNWRAPENDDLKMQMMRAAWGVQIPDHVQYLIPDGLEVGEAGGLYLNDVFFGGTEPERGAKELHRYTTESYTDHGLLYTGAPRFVVLRIRHAQVMPPPFIAIEGFACVLVQFGHGNDHALMGADGATKRVINFMKEWGWE